MASSHPFVNLSSHSHKNFFLSSFSSSLYFKGREEDGKCRKIEDFEGLSVCWDVTKAGCVAKYSHESRSPRQIYVSRYQKGCTSSTCPLTPLSLIYYGDTLATQYIDIISLAITICAGKKKKKKFPSF